MHPTTARVAAALRAAGLETDVREFDETTRTAQQAADTLGVAVGAIVKSLCFMADGEPAMVLVSGANRADLGKVRQLRLLLDRDLLHYDELWAAAGTPNSVFRITPSQLVAVTGGQAGDVAEEVRP